MSTNGHIRVVLVPRQVSARRPTDTVERPPQALTDGVRDLDRAPAIPEYFSEDVVRRVQKVGDRLGKDGLEGVDLVPVVDGVARAGAAVTREMAENATRAVLPASSAHSSVTGVLNVLSAKGEKVRAVIEDPRTHRSVVCEVDRLPKPRIRELWGEHVLASGLMTRNTQGQPIRLVVDDLHAEEPAHELPPRLTARQLLGAAPHWTGELTTTEYMDQVRRRA